MSNDTDFDERLDRAIDRAVRDIMSADPPAGLRRRVMARLDGRAPTRSATFTWRPAVYGFATVAIIVLAFLVIGRDGPVQTPRETHTAAEAPPPAIPERVAPATPPVTTPPVRSAEPTRTAGGRFRPARERITMPPVADVFGVPSERVAATSTETAEPARVEADISPGLAVAPLAPPIPIVVPPLTTPPITVPRIEIPPIELRRIQPSPSTRPR